MNKAAASLVLIVFGVVLATYLVRWLDKYEPVNYDQMKRQ